MSILRSLLFLVLMSTLLSCLVTPLVYSSLVATMEEVPWPYSRVFDRVALVMVTVLAFRMRKRLDLSTLRPHYRNWRARGEWRRAGFGAALAITTGLLALPLVVAGEQLTWHPDNGLGELLWKALGFVPAAILIAMIEESFFRALLFGKLDQRLPTFAAALLASLFYAAVHFVAPEKSFEYLAWSPTVGFEYLLAIVPRFTAPGIAEGMLGLTLIGLTLCYTLARTGSLALCMGLHAGWVLVAKMTLKIARRTPGVEFPTGVGRRNFLVAQPEAWGAILACMFVLWLVYGRSEARSRLADPVEG